MARLNGWKARLRQLDSSRFQLTCIFVAYYAVWIAPGRISMGDTSLSRLGRVISVYSARTHFTILVYASTLLCKLEANAKNSQTHQLAVHNQQLRMTWKPFILTKNLGVPKD